MDTDLFGDVSLNETRSIGRFCCEIIDGKMKTGKYYRFLPLNDPNTRPHYPCQYS